MNVNENICNLTYQITKQKISKSIICREGNSRKTIDNHDIYYKTKNQANGIAFDPYKFERECPTFTWEDDFEVLIEKLCVRPINVVISINFSKKIRTLEKKDHINEVTEESTFIELVINAITVTSSQMNIRRTIFSSKVLEKGEILKAIKVEIDHVNDNYRYFTDRCLIDIKPNDYEIILPAGVGGIFIHEAIGHCLEADLFFNKRNVLFGKLGKRITGNSMISISDSCTEEYFINYEYSDDGAPPKNVNLINNGYLINIMTDEYTSLLSGLENTGNGRSLDCNSPPIPRMRNTYLHNGTVSSNEIIKTTKKGVIATEIAGGNVTMENGNFVFNIPHGLIIENGEITGITQPFLYTGNIINAMDTIDAIGDDLLFKVALCGKAGQQILVSYGQPTIRICQNGVL